MALLPEPDAGDAFRRRDGRVLPVACEELAYSTPELLALEQRLMERVLDSRGSGAGTVAVDEVVAARQTLSGEQRAMVEHLCLDGDGVSVVVGKAGTGKTSALGGPSPNGWPRPRALALTPLPTAPLPLDDLSGPWGLARAERITARKVAELMDVPVSTLAHAESGSVRRMIPKSSERASSRSPST